MTASGLISPLILNTHRLYNPAMETKSKFLSVIDNDTEKGHHSLAVSLSQDEGKASIYLANNPVTGISKQQ